MYEEVDDVHLVSGEWISDLRAGPVALRPRTVIEAVVVALVLVVLDVVDVVQVEEDGRASLPSCAASAGYRRRAVPQPSSVPVTLASIPFSVLVVTVVTLWFSIVQIFALFLSW